MRRCVRDKTNAYNFILTINENSRYQLRKFLNQVQAL